MSLLREITNSASEAITFLIIIQNAQQATQIKDKINVEVTNSDLEDSFLVKQDALQYHSKCYLYFIGEFRAASNGASNNICVLTYFLNFGPKSSWLRRLVLGRIFFSY